jgi:hypothetical protein
MAKHSMAKHQRPGHGLTAIEPAPPVTKEGSLVPAGGRHPDPEGFTSMTTGDQSHRFAITGQDPEGRNRTVVLWQETDLSGGFEGHVVRRVVVTLDATMTTPPGVVTRL